jgi:DNA-binding SARP family transcriptional activator
MDRLKTLGAFDLADERGSPEALGALTQPKRAAVLLYLALQNPGEWQRRDLLLALLWPELDDSRARNALSQALHHLRRSLGPEAMPGQGADLIRLDPERVWCDAAAFLQLARDGKAAEALALYGGDLAPGFHVAEAPDFERWLDGERQRLRTVAFDCACTTAMGAEARGDLRGAVEALRQAVAFRSEDEVTLRRLMGLLAQSGDRASALRTYEQFVARLRADLEIEPSEETRMLAQQLRDAAPAESQASSRARRGSGAESGLVPSSGPGLPEPATASRPPVRRWRIELVVLALVGVVVTATAARHFFRTGVRSTDASDARVAIAPFRLAGADPSLNYLREGLVDLLAAKLSGDSGTRALDPRAVFAAWRGAVGSSGDDLTPEDALLVTERLGARRLVLGGVVGRPERLVVTASLREVPAGKELARATVEGSADSLPELVDRLAAKLMALDAGEGDERLAGLTSTSLAALRPYLAAQVAFRAGRYDAAVQEYQRALEADSGFTLAALGLAAAGLWVPTAEAARREALSIAWAGRDRLKPADRAYLVALAGPRYPAEPTARERLVAWERAAALAPDRPDVWYEYGDVLFHKGALLGIGGAWGLARSAFERAVRLDSTYAAASLHLFEVVTAEGDTAQARVLADLVLRSDSSSEHADFVRWRTAHATGDVAALARLRGELGRMSFGSLWRIIGTAQLEGIGLDDANRAAEELARRASTRADRITSVGYLAELALNEGRPRDAAALVAELPSDDAARAIIDALYADGDTLAARATARSLSLTERRPLARDSVQRAFQLIDRCALGQWRLWHGDTTGVGDVLRDLRPANDRNMPWWAVGRLKVCESLLGALQAVQRRDPDAGNRVAELDSVLEVGMEVGVREPGNLASAKLHEALGDRAGALAALRRREYHHRTGIPFLATRLGDLARLAAEAGLRDEAIAAARHYLALRAAPASERLAATDAVRALLARLAPSP